MFLVPDTFVAFCTEAMNLMLAHPILKAFFGMQIMKRDEQQQRIAELQSAVDQDSATQPSQGFISSL